MNNYIVINGVTYDLVERTNCTVEASAGDITADGVAAPMPQLADLAVKSTCKIGGHELIVMEQADGETLLLRKESLKNFRFGDNNNYNGSAADKVCQEFAEEIAGIVGEENMVEFTVDLTADDGLKDYGEIRRKAALLTANQCRKYVDVLDEHKLDEWWWTATAYSTPKHGDKVWVKCVSPDGNFNDFNYFFNNVNGVRPFCILKSHIFVSR